MLLHIFRYENQEEDEKEEDAPQRGEISYSNDEEPLPRGIKM